MLCFHTQFNIIFLDLVFPNLIHCSFFCFGHLQGTAPMLCTRSGATSWIEWSIHGATACILLARSSARIEPPYQHQRSAMPGRHHSKTLFPHFFCKNLSSVAFSSAYQTCVTESDACGLRFYGLRLIWVEIQNFD